MSSKVPMVRQAAWISIIPQLLVMGLIFLIWYQFTQTQHILGGALTYLALSQVLRRTVAREHRSGMSKVKAMNFEEAIPYFERSYEFFQKYDWVDKYRYVTVLSSAGMAYKEMALNNIAFCYSQIGNGKLAKEYYERTLAEYPDNSIALAALNLINSAGSDAEEETG
jgi:tetratricopeptide (TPR) repeat protein